MAAPQRPSIICSVDVVLLTIAQGALQVALLERSRDPFRGALALPGGFIHPAEDEDTEAAAMRMLRDKAGIVSPYLEQLGTFSGRARDPRGWSLAVTYYALVPHALLADSRAQVVLRPAASLPSLPFDHSQIVRGALERVQSKSSYSSLPVYLCGDTFTLPELQAVYEIVMGEPVNKVSFRRKMEELELLEAVPGALTQGKAHRPAQLYRLRAKFRKKLALSDRALNAGS
ncbi:MAG: NUDIX domain-containing protein [Polyangiaceae bacterium]